MLEDELEDILGKSMRGLGLTPSHFSLLESDLPSLSGEKLNSVAKQLNLDINKLNLIGSPVQPISLPDEMSCIVSHFGHLGVNAFLIETGQKRYLFDTGTEREKVANLDVDHIFITHQHHDHIECLDSFKNIPVDTPETLNAGTEIDLGTISIRLHDVSGHCSPAIAYEILGLSKPVCIVGDAIFKRSIGGCRTQAAYQTALHNIQQLLAKLTPTTILCVGHGPQTTVELECKENAFPLIK